MLPPLCSSGCALVLARYGASLRMVEDSDHYCMQKRRSAEVLCRGELQERVRAAPRYYEEVREVSIIPEGSRS
jgi:hypothetical protein